MLTQNDYFEAFLTMDEYGFAKEVFLESVEDDWQADDPLQWMASMFTSSKQVKAYHF